MKLKPVLERCSWFLDGIHRPVYHLHLVPELVVRRRKFLSTHAWELVLYVIQCLIVHVVSEGKVIL